MIDSLLGIPRSGSIGETLAGARRYMLPEHRDLMEALDGAAGILRNYVLESGDAALMQCFDECLQLLGRWRQSHQSRGALYIRPDEDAADSYASTGLVVGLDCDRVDTFKRSMQAHLADTRGQMLATPAAPPRRCPFHLAS
jgi:hypothetical protein